MSGARPARPKAWGFVPLAGAYLLVIFLVSPAGEFPLNDDWIYYSAVKQRLETGTDLIDEDTSAYLYPQRYYGTALARAFGFSFVLLRMTGIVAGLLCLFLAYRLLARLEFPTFACVAGAALLLANPIFLNLSYSFMTDLPYLAFFLGALLFYVRATQRRSRSDLALASLLTMLALAQRQIGLLLCPAALIYFFALRRHRRLAWGDWVLLLLPALFFVVLTVMRHLDTITQTSLLHLLDPRQWARLYRLKPLSDQPGMTDREMLDFYRLVLVSLPASLGLLVLPLVLGALAPLVRALKTLPRAFPWAVLGSLGLLVGLRASALDAPVNTLQVRTMPFLTNILNTCGVGAGPGHVLAGECRPLFTPLFWDLLTALALGAGACLLGLALAWVSRSRRRIAWRNLTLGEPGRGPGDAAPAGGGLVVLAGATQIVPFFVVWPLDRYLVPLIVPAAVLILELFRGHRLARSVTVAALIPFLLYGVMGLHDYLSWNRLRWDLGRELLAQQVPVQKIEGGLEWLGWHLYFERRGGAPGPVPGDSLLWYVHHMPDLDPEFVISASELIGYRSIGSRTAGAWIPGSELRLHVLRRAGD